jgi:hypothetical protein
MRHQTQPEQMTRLLLQKPAPVAHLDENAKIAISVLQDDGWSVEQIGMEIKCSVTTTPIPKEGDLTLVARQLVESEARFIQLRAEVDKQQTKSSTEAWKLATGVAFICTGLGLVGHPAYGYLVIAVCAIFWAAIPAAARWCKKGTA